MQNRLAVAWTPDVSHSQDHYLPSVVVTSVDVKPIISSDIMNTLRDNTADPVPEAKSRRLGAAHILYVEDDSALRNLCEMVLTGAGYVVTSAEDGLKAWEALHRQNFDLVITDNELPQLTGLELIANARLEGNEVPIILASTSARDLAGLSHESLHLAACLEKPFMPDDLLTTVEHALHTDSKARNGGEIFSFVISQALRNVTSHGDWGLNE